MLKLLSTACLAAVLCVQFEAVAATDVRVSEEAEDEIRIGNTGWNEGDALLVAQQSPDAAGETTAGPSMDVAGNMPFAETVRHAASANSLDPALLHAVIAAESNHDPRAVSPQGARGLMQLMPATARHLGVTDPYDPVQNIHAGARYLSELKEMFRGNLGLTLAAYNAGPGAVLRHGSRIPPYEETRRYVPRVMQFYRKLSGRQI